MPVPEYVELNDLYRGVVTYNAFFQDSRANRVSGVFLSRSLFSIKFAWPTSDKHIRTFHTLPILVTTTRETRFIPQRQRMSCDGTATFLLALIMNISLALHGIGPMMVPPYTKNNSEMLRLQCRFRVITQMILAHLRYPPQSQHLPIAQRCMFSSRITCTSLAHTCNFVATQMAIIALLPVPIPLIMYTHQRGINVQSTTLWLMTCSDPNTHRL